jgi:hypothetical protein
MRVQPPDPKHCWRYHLPLGQDCSTWLLSAKQLSLVEHGEIFQLLVLAFTTLQLRAPKCVYGVFVRACLLDDDWYSFTSHQWLLRECVASSLDVRFFKRLSDERFMQVETLVACVNQWVLV